jgi:hypothetical protein
MTQSDQQHAVPNQPKMNFKKAPSFRTFYANWVQPTYSPFDISLTIGEAIPIDQQTFEIEQSARITFSPLEAKLVALMLLNALKIYESSFGKINIPQGVAGGNPMPEGIDFEQEEEEKEEGS